MTDTIDSLVNIVGNLKEAYRQIVPGTMRHVDQLTTERRTNHDLKRNWIYTSDGELYTAKEEKIIWGITREPQNLVLQNIDEAYRQLTENGNYFPILEEAQSSFEHSDTVVVDIKGLKLVKDCGEYGHFVVDPKNVKKLNSQQKLAAKRIYGPDEDNFRQNLEMFSKDGKCPLVFVLMPDYVQHTLRQNNKKYLGRASWLSNFNDDSSFVAIDRSIGLHLSVRGARREVLAAGAAQKKVDSPSPEQHLVHLPTRDEILTTARPYIAPPLWREFAKIIPDTSPVLGDVLQQTIDGKYLSPHSLETFKTQLGALYKNG